MSKKIAAAFAAALALALFAPAAQAQKALVYCPVGVDATGCDRIVAALQPKFPDGVDRGYDGTNSTVDLMKVDLEHYAVIVVPSLADDDTKRPYSVLRKAAARLHLAVNGRVAVYSGAPDQGSANRSDKDAIIQNLAAWSAKGHTRATGLVGLVAFLDLSENTSARYSWVKSVSLADVSADAETQSIADLTPAGRGGDLLANAGRAIRFSNMASYGLHIGARAAARTEVGAMSTATDSHQSVLVTYANADGKDLGTNGGRPGGASLDVSAGGGSGPTLTTDKPDYLPGDTVLFSGTGWAPNDTVTITVHEDPQWSNPDRTVTAVANGNGNLSSHDFVVQQRDFGVTFTATAVGNPSGLVAQTTFADGNPQSMSASPSSVSVAAGASASYPITVTFNGNNSTCTMDFTVTTSLPSGTGFSFSPNPGVSNNQDPIHTTLTITTSPGTPTGTTPFTVQATRHSDCQGSIGQTLTTTGTLIVTAPTATTTTVAPATATFGDASVTLAATVAPSSVNAGVVTFTVKQGATTIGAATVSPTVSAGTASVTYSLPSGTSAGAYSVQADYSGGGGFAASSSTGALTINMASQTITFGALANKTFGDPDFTVNATASSGLAVTFTATDQCTITGNSVHITGAGSCTVKADQAGNGNYNAASQVPQTFTIAKANQTITFGALANKTFGDPDFPVSATASSGLTVTFTATDQCTITGNSVHITGAGSCTVKADQTGNGNYNAAPQVPQTFTIAKANQTITFGALANKTFGDPDFTVSATASSGLTVTFTATDQCTITGNSVHITGAGSCTVKADQTGNGNYNAAPQVPQTFTIDKAPTTTTVTCPASGIVFDGNPQTPCTAAATGAGNLNQSLTPSYMNNTNAGTATANATFGGDANHLGSSGSATFTIDKAPSTTTVTCPASGIVFNGNPQTPCAAAATGAGNLNQSLTPSYMNNTNAGTATANATFGGDANHLGSSGSATFTIDKAPSTTTVTCPASGIVFNGNPQTPCAAAATGVGGLNQSLTVNYTNNVNAGTASADASFGGDANHLQSTGTATFTIDKAPSTTTVACPASGIVFNGNAQTPCTAAATGAGNLNQSLTPAYMNNINAGTATANATFGGDANHLGSTGSATFTIDKAPSTTTVSCPASGIVFNGNAQTPCSAAATGAGNLNQSLTVYYTNNTHAGTASATATFGGDPNHLGSTGSGTFTIQKFQTTIDWNPADIPQGTALSSTQLNAVARGVGGADITSQGTFTYNPASGTVLVNVGPTPLLASFVASNTDYKDASKNASINVTNVPPTVAAIVAPADPVPLGSPLTINTSFTDPGGSADSPYSVVINWGKDPISGLPLGPTNTSAGGPGPISQSHTYTAAGIYTITVTVTDKNGGVGSNTTTNFVVVYDPSGGFVTGGGWINSPAGAYAADPTLTGKASFGFVSKYQKGQTTPDGNTEFQFHEGNLNFSSTSYDWLVINGAKAQFKGSGTINGTGDYGFMLTAIDGGLKGKGNPDTFRIKIVNKSTGATVYDNLMSPDDTLDPTTTLGGGSIQIHN